MAKPGKHYVVIRADLPWGLQASQALHASHVWIRANRSQFEQWQDEHNTVVLLSAPDADELDRLVARAISAGVPVSAFTDDDLGHRLTSVAFGPSDAARKLCRKYEPAFKEVAKKAA